VAVSVTVGGGLGGGGSGLKATSLGGGRGQRRGRVGGLSFPHFPELIREVVLHGVIVPVVLPDNYLLLFFLIFVPLFSGKLFKLIIFLQEPQIHLVIFFVVSHFGGRFARLWNCSCSKNFFF